MSERWNCLAYLAGLALALFCAAPAVGAPAKGAKPAPKAPAAAQPNGFDYAMRAIRRMKGVPGYEKAWDPETPPAEAAAVVARCRPALDELRAGFAHPYAAPPIDPNAPDSGYLGGARDLARMLAMESRVAAGRADPDRALRCLAEALHLGRDVTRDACLLTALVGMACESPTLTELTSIGASLDARQCREAVRVLAEHEAARSSFPKALEREAVFVDAIWPTLEKEMAKTGSPAERAAAVLLLKGSRGKTKEMCLEIARQADLPAGKRTLVAPAVPPAATFWGVYDRALTNNDARLARMRLLQVELCLRSLQIEKGRPAASLADLVPEYLPMVPADPFGQGEALRFGADGHAYSVGSDGEESAGRVLLWIETKAGAAGDLVVRLGERERKAPDAAAP